MTTHNNLAECPICKGHYVITAKGTIQPHGWRAGAERFWDEKKGTDVNAFVCPGSNTKAGDVTGKKAASTAAAKDAAYMKARIDKGDRFRDEKGNLLQVDSQQSPQQYIVLKKTPVGVSRMKISAQKLRKMTREPAKK